MKFVAEVMDQAMRIGVYDVDDKKLLDAFERALHEVLQEHERYILLKAGDGRKRVALSDILYVESSNKKVIFHTNNGSLEIYGTMRDTEKRLGDGFYRCHRCYIVNLEKISSYSSDTIRLVNGVELIIAQKKYNDFIERYMSFIGK